MYTAMLLLAICWPFTHKQNSPKPIKPTATVENPQIINEPVIPEGLCGHTPEIGWDFAGPDGMVGISVESCQKAFENWNAQPSNPVLMNRV